MITFRYHLLSLGAVLLALAAGVALGVFVAVNSVIALYYYARIGLLMWAEEAPDQVDRLGRGFVLFGRRQRYLEKLLFLVGIGRW